MQGERTGVGQYVIALVRALLRFADEHEFHLWVLRSERKLFEFASGRMVLQEMPDRLRPPLVNIGWHHTMAPRWLIEQGIDVFHVPSYRRLIWRRPCALVATIHDLAPFRVPGKYGVARMFYGRVIARQLASRQDRIITVSEETARDVVRYFGVESARVRPVYNGLDHDRFFPATAERGLTEGERAFGIEAPFFLYVARLEHPGKNHVRLIQAFDAFKRRTASVWKLVLAGSDWRGAEIIHETARKAEFGGDIHRIGFVAQEALPEWYRRAGGFVYPSLFEGFGFPPLEAMACGCPVVCSNRGSLPEVIGNATLAIDPEDLEGLERALECVALDHGLRERLRAAGLAQARRFQWSTTAERTMLTYAEALAISRSRASLSPAFSSSPQPPR
jgi:glycosyltransferase involved in cell wall biosynthesis